MNSKKARNQIDLKLKGVGNKELPQWQIYAISLQDIHKGLRV